MAPVVFSWGELLWDLFPDGPRLGGAAANVAYHAAVLGAHALLVSRVGDDELGRRALDELAGAGVDTRFVEVDGEHPTGSVRVVTTEGEPRYAIADRAAWDRIEAGPGLLRELASAESFVFGTLAQRTPLGSAALGAALDVLPPRCRRIADLNVRPPHVTRAVVETALARAQVVKLNADEAEQLARLFDLDAAGLRERYGLELVVTTLGARGAELFGRDAHFVHPGFPLERDDGDSVGAGDAFTALLAVELASGRPLASVLARANRYASFVASLRGGMPRLPAPWLEALARCG